MKSEYATTGYIHDRQRRWVGLEKGNKERKEGNKRKEQRKVGGFICLVMGGFRKRGKK